jgi:sterol desaturase/sphingolipid hydroxylase (fatty acid hydroxylase superfamily)
LRKSRSQDHASHGLDQNKYWAPQSNFISFNFTRDVHKTLRHGIKTVCTLEIGRQTKTIGFLTAKNAHHNHHHQISRGNYALYFTFWDKAMGTDSETLAGG